MRHQDQIPLKEIQFFIITSMVFAICEVLSIELNNYFNEINILGYRFQFNISVTFFCLSFFILDLVTEIYDNKVSDYFIYAKLISQIFFIFFGKIGIIVSGITSGEIFGMFSDAQYTILDSMIASLLGYKLTGKIMMHLKIKYNGKFLFSRYLSSTFPGEILFSFIFTMLSFSRGRKWNEILNIFLDLILIKFSLSFIFSLLVIPVTNIIKNYLCFYSVGRNDVSMPFK